MEKSLCLDCNMLIDPIPVEDKECGYTNALAAARTT